MSVFASTDIQEAALAEWLFTDLMPSRLLAEALDLTTGTKLAFLTKTQMLAPDARGPGDIDVLAVDPAQPDRAVAIEVKRVKIPPVSYWTSLPNKLEEIGKGCKQVELLREIGFRRSYLLVAVVADGRERTDVNFAFRGPTPGLVNAVRDKVTCTPFHPDVGILVVEVTQPVEKDIVDAGAIGISLHRRASPIAQPLSLTASISHAFSI